MSNLFDEEPKQERESLISEKTKHLVQIILTLIAFPFIWLWEKLCEHFVPLSLIISFTIILGMSINVVVKDGDGEVSKHQYKQIVEWTDEIPTLKPFVQHRLEDNKITLSEYIEIRQQHHKQSFNEYKDKLR